MENTHAPTSSLRRVLFVLVLVALAPLALVRTETSAQAPANGPIAATALKYLNTYGGQCWTFMDNVVKEATGRDIGYGYRDGYLAAGAVEVSAADAQNGDIIQISSNAGGFGSYPGLHTAIILENLGGGRFNAIDSNQNWDEWIRLRPNYDPYASAARYGLTVRIWRIPGGGPGGAGADVPAAAPAGPVTWGAGAQAIVDTSGCLNLRNAPTLGAARVGCLPTGNAMTATGAPVEADGYTWLPVDTTAGPGWVAVEYLAQTAPPTQAVAAASEAPAAAAPAVEAAGETIAYTDGSPGCLRVRDDSGLSATIIDCLPASTPVTVLPDQPIESEGYTWTKVRVNGRVGWLAAEYLVR